MATTPPAAQTLRMFSSATGVISFIQAVHRRVWYSARILVFRVWRSAGLKVAA